MKNKLEKYWLLLLVLFFLPIIVFALNTWDTGYRINHGGDTKEVIVGSADGDCHKVTNNHASNDYFVPTKTTAEWNAFEVHLPAGVSVSECSPTCVPGNYYDWAGTCAEFCAGMGGDAEGTGVIAEEESPAPCENSYSVFNLGANNYQECEIYQFDEWIYETVTMCRCSCP